MPDILYPSTPEELRLALETIAAAKRPIDLFGANTKRQMAGPSHPGALALSTAKLTRILQYEPRDLTVSVEAGMPFADLNRELARHGQMIPLDGAYAEDATVGGMIAANSSGSRRRLYGTARDLVIGMTFATLDGKLVQTGGMVVKNVAGLDMGKLLIGSFGTLAAIASVNFKLTPRPAAERTLLFAFDDLKPAVAARDALLRGVLNPVAIDLLNPLLVAQLNLTQFNVKGYVLALLFGGNEAVIERSTRDAAKLGPHRALSVEEDQRFWSALQRLTPRHMEKFKDGAVGRIATPLTQCADALATAEGPALAHAASGVVRSWFNRADAAARWVAASSARGWKGVVEFSPEAAKRELTLWPNPGSDFAIMKEIKRMFDPDGLLNAGRLYGHL